MGISISVPASLTYSTAGLSPSCFCSSSRSAQSQADVGLGDRERAFGTDELREFEHVLQQGGQGRGALPDLGLKSLPGRRLLFREQQFGEAVDGVQRRAYLVAHRVDEGGLHFFALLGAAALALRLFAGRHELRARQLQPPDHRLLVGGPAGEQQQHDAAGDKQEEFVAVGQPGLFEFEAVDVVDACISASLLCAWSMRLW